MARSTTKANNNWEVFADQGKVDNKIRTKVEQLIDEYQKSLPDNPFDKDATNLLTFTKEFTDELESKFKTIFGQFSDLTKKQINHWRKTTTEQLKKLLDLLVRKKALCTIRFKDSSLIYRFIQALTNITDEVSFKIQKDQLFISLYDDNIISLAKVEIHSSTYTFYREGTVALNLDDFEKLLKADKNSETTLIFGEDDVYISVFSHKFKISVERVLNQINLTSEDANFIKLDELEYCCNFEINKEQLEYLIANLGRYSDVFRAECTPERLVFGEMGQIGSGEVCFPRDKISKIELHKDDEDSELQECEYYSLPYLKKLYKMSSILDNSDPVQFFLTREQPLKCVANFKKLDNTKIVFYFAPRAERDEYEEEEDDFEEVEKLIEI